MDQPNNEPGKKIGFFFQPDQEERLGRFTTLLAQYGINYTIEGNELYVPNEVEPLALKLFIRSRADGLQPE